MQIPLQITFRDIPHSDPVEQYVRQKAAKLDATDPRITSCRVAVEMPHRHARHGEHFRVRIDITVPGGEIVVGHTPGEKRAYEDLYAAVDAAFDDAVRQLHDFVRRQRGDSKTHEGGRHGHVVKLFTYEGYGFLRTREGEELYFHRNSVLHGGFARLKIGSRVRFVEDTADGGPRATTVEPA